MVESDSMIITPRTWEDELGDWMRNFFNSHSEIVFSQNFKPLAEGAVLIHPVIGLTNDVITLSTDNDIYGNDVSPLDKGIAIVDLLSTNGLLVFLRLKLLETATIIGNNYLYEEI